VQGPARLAPAADGPGEPMGEQAHLGRFRAALARAAARVLTRKGSGCGTASDTRREVRP